jgi:hypothetical protein
MEPDSSPQQPEGSVQNRRRRPSTKWYVAGSLACSFGSIVSKFFFDLLASRGMMAIARREPVRQDSVVMELLGYLAVVLAVGALLFGIPAALRGNAVSRVAVLVAFLAAVAILFVMV